MVVVVVVVAMVVVVEVVVEVVVVMMFCDGPGVVVMRRCGVATHHYSVAIWRYSSVV